MYGGPVTTFPYLGVGVGLRRVHYDELLETQRRIDWLELITEKKTKLRIEARVAEGGGMRPGTAELVEQMTELAGDPEVYRAQKAVQALDVEDELARLKAAMEQDED